MSSFLVLSDGDTRNRWRDGQVCPDVGQGTMAPWARRPGCVLACDVQIGRGRPRVFCDLPIRGEEREKRKKERREETEKRRERERRERRGDGKRKGRRRKKRRKRVGREREEPALYGEKG
ncbi:hypothetical protein TNCV_3632651 [Trichonephila clavipes]|nr:hypothetical protein TNCV_3632651 [Trichonephila clavipes]